MAYHRMRKKTTSVAKLRPSTLSLRSQPFARPFRALSTGLPRDCPPSEFVRRFWQRLNDFSGFGAENGHFIRFGNDAASSLAARLLRPRDRPGETFSVHHNDDIVVAIAVGTPITERPPHRSLRARFTHRAPTSDV